MLKTLQKSRAIRGISSLATMKYATKFMSLLRLAIVARLLGPNALGLYGLALLVVAISEVFTETGINIVLLKKPKKFEYFYDTAWLISLVRGMVIATTIALFSPFLARWYGSLQLTWYLLLASLIPLLRGLINPAIVRYQQQLQFEKESLLRIFLQIIDIVTGLLAVLWWQSGLGLLLGVVASVFVEVIASFWLFSDRPNLFKAEWQRVRDLYHESKFIIGNGFIHYLTENFDDFLIGKILGISALGMYQTAYKLASAATMDLAAIFGQTLYPIYAQMSEKKESVDQLLRRSTIGLTGILFIASIPFLFFSRQLIIVILGNEWLDAAPIVPILFLAGVFKAYITIWNPLAILSNLLHHHLVINSIILMSMIAGIVLFAPQFGLVGASWAICFSFILVHPYAWWVTWKARKLLA